jgi:hypothetical protein
LPPSSSRPPPASASSASGADGSPRDRRTVVAACGSTRAVCREVPARRRVVRVGTAALARAASQATSRGLRIPCSIPNESDVGCREWAETLCRTKIATTC